MPAEAARPSRGRRRRRRPQVSADKILTVPIAALTLSEHLALDPVNNDRLADLAASIQRHGILHPLLVRVQPGGYEVLSGGRRLAAARLAGLTDVPIVVQETTQEVKDTPAEAPPRSQPRMAEPEPARRPASGGPVRQATRRPARSSGAAEPSRQPVKRVQRRRMQTLQFGRGQLLIDYEAGTVDLRRARLEDLQTLLHGVGEARSLDELIHRLERLSPHL